MLFCLSIFLPELGLLLLQLYFYLLHTAMNFKTSSVLKSQLEAQKAKEEHPLRSITHSHCSKTPTLHSGNTDKRGKTTQWQAGTERQKQTKRLNHNKLKVGRTKWMEMMLQFLSGERSEEKKKVMFPTSCRFQH